MSSLKVLFGRRLKLLREQHKMTQLQLAIRIGLTNDEISNIERGLHSPRFETIEKLAQELHVPVWQLFYFE
jgi:transcriptional regulator with XRE-family HTH domain